VRRSLRALSGELAELGHAAGPDTVWVMPINLQYSTESRYLGAIRAF
jgi:hypothetical protein